MTEGKANGTPVGIPRIQRPAAMPHSMRGIGARVGARLFIGTNSNLIGKVRKVALPDTFASRYLQFLNSGFALPFHVRTYIPMLGQRAEHY